MSPASKLVFASLAIAALAACGHTAPPPSQAYVCYPVDAGADGGGGGGGGFDAGDCQLRAPPGCVLQDLAQGDPGGTTVWCCADVAAGKLLCCPQP